VQFSPFLCLAQLPQCLLLKLKALSMNCLQYLIVQKQIKGIQNLIIKPLFGGVSKEDPQKLFVIHQASESMFKSLWKQMVTG
tara:strand:+ start:276 stop:521 length:246 start_codon:yes stop_codon:yes gene_type:complete